MIFLWKYAVYLFITFSILPSVYGIKCWDCRSDIDPKCGDPFDNSTLPLTDCSSLEIGLPNMCRTIRQNVNGEWHYIRNCAYSGDVGDQEDERFCQMKADSNNIIVEYCTCNGKDGCNSSYQFTPAPSFVVLLMSLPYLVFKILT